MISDTDIRRAVSGNAFMAGLRLFGLDGVMSVTGDSKGETIEGRVHGSAHAVYRQQISLAQRPGGGLRVTATCTCPAHRDCKHIAAVLFAFRAKLAHDDAPPRPTLATPAPPPQPTIPGDVAAWLRALDAAQHEDSEDYPPTVRKRLLYVVDHEPVAWNGLDSPSNSPSISPQSIELRRDGTTHGAARHPVDQLLRSPPKFLRPSDRSILNRLTALTRGDSEGSAAVLRAIIATGRGRWGTWTGPVLNEGPPVPGTVEWQLRDDGTQVPALTLPEGLLPLRLPIPWYVDPARGTLGPIETELPPRILQILLASPSLPPAVADLVRAELPQRLPGRTLPAPRPLAPPTILRGPPHPHLLLLGGTLPYMTSSHGTSPTPPGTLIPVARLSFRYGPPGPNAVTLRAVRRPPAHTIVQRDGTLFDIHRDRETEQDFDLMVQSAGLTPILSYMLPMAHPNLDDMLMQDPDPGAWVDFMLTELPTLRESGWTVDIDPTFPLRIVEPDGDLEIDIQESSGLDWFDFGLGIMVAGERVNLVPALLDIIANAGPGALTGLAADTEDRDTPILLPLPDGRLLAVPLAQLQPILAPLLELFEGAQLEPGAETLRLSRWNAADLALLEAAGGTWSGGDGVRALGRQLRQHGGIPPVPTPPGFMAELRPYQSQGLAWLQFLASAGLGGVLADDMGLGKTVQALAHLVVEQAAGRLDRPALVIGPTSLVPNWTTEAARFAPTLKVLVLHGPDRAAHFDRIAEHDLVITTYPLLSRDHEVLTAQSWHVVVLDEAQTIKNPQATTSKLARALQARQRLALSGTPLENHLGELWSLFDFLLPGFLGTRQHFGRRYRTPIEKAGSTERQALLARRVAPFLLRRTKQQVAADLPPKTEIAEIVEMDGHQRALYDAIRLAMHAKVKAAVAKRGISGSGIIILDALLKLRQACCDPRLVKLETARKGRAGSAKLDRLLEMLALMLEDGRRILLFSQFTSMLALIEAELTRLRIPYVLLTGDTKDRATPIHEFQSGQVPLFLISLKAGGTGLNLTAADTVIHYDPWWNPAVENQATDRAHRIGQDKPVFVHRLVTSGTIEEKMEVLKARKQALADGILGASAGITTALTERDLDMLFDA